MAVEIKSGNSTDLSTVDPTSKALRVTSYDSSGNEIIQSLPVSIIMSDVTVVDNDLIDSLDVSAYKFVSIQLTGTWVGTVSFQGSNDNGTFYDVAVQDPRALATPYVTALSAVGLVKVPIIFKYLRVRVTAYTSGTVSGTSFGYKEENSTGQISSTGEVTIADTAGAVCGPMLTGLEGQEHLPVGIIQDVFVSVSNSTDTNLDAAQIFTGVSQSTKGVSSIDLSAACNENLTIEIQQSHNGSDFDHGDTYLLAGGTETHRNFKALSAFFRIKITNTSSSTTTSLHVNVTLTPVSEVLPSALSQNGNLKTAILEALPAGSNIIGSVLIEPSPINMETDLYVGIAGDASFNARNIKNAATTLRSLVFTNLAATPRYLKLYDTAGTPTAGAGAPVLLVSLPAVGTLAFPLPDEGFVFANGIGMTMTLKPEHSDLTNTATVDFSTVAVYTA